MTALRRETGGLGVAEVPADKRPPHAPPYLATLPGHDPPGTQALLPGGNIIETVGALRHGLLGRADPIPWVCLEGAAA